MDKILLRPEEAADQLGVSRTKLYQLLSNGAIPSVRIGKSVRIRADVLRQWVSDRTGEEPTGACGQGIKQEL